MAKGGPEATAEAVAATLATYLPAALTSIWADYGDAATVPQVAPRQVFAMRHPLLPEFPVVVCEPMAGRQVGNGATAWGELDHTIAVTAWLRGDSETVLQRQASRYLWGIWRVLMEQQGLDGSLSGLAGVDPTQYVYGDVAKHGQTALLLQPVGWEVVVHVMETA